MTCLGQRHHRHRHQRSLLVGPLVGGALVGAAGPQAVYGLNVVSFLVSALVIARLHGTFAGYGSKHGTGAGGRWRTVGADRQRRRLFAVTALTFAAFGVTWSRISPWSTTSAAADGYALLTTLWGTGAIVARRSPPASPPATS